MAKKKNTIPTRVDADFKKMLEGFKLKRIKNGKDNPLKPTSDARMTLALTRLIKKYPNLSKEVELSDFK
jgi:hypothetical protein